MEQQVQPTLEVLKQEKRILAEYIETAIKVFRYRTGVAPFVSINTIATEGPGYGDAKITQMDIKVSIEL